MITLTSVVGGLRPFNHGNINETFKALVKSSSLEPAFPAVIKDLPHRELFNELFAFIVLRELGLPVPTAYIGQVDSSETKITKAPLLPNGNRLVFVSAEMPTPSFKFITGLNSTSTSHQIQLCLEHFVPMIAKWGMLGELYAFDLWNANIDRNLGNILLGGLSTAGVANVWLIDHGRSFSSENWQARDLKPDIDYKNKLTDWASPYLSDVHKKECLASAINFESKARGFDKDAKIDYLAKMFSLDKRESDAAKNFLKVRLDTVVKRSKEALAMGGGII